MRAALLVLVVVFVGACGAKRASGPAWPKSAGKVEVDPEKDGGESLEPQHASHVAAVERAEDPTPVVDKEAIVVVEEPKPEEPKPEAKTDSKPPTGEIEVIEVKPEDIVIDR